MKRFLFLLVYAAISATADSPEAIAEELTEAENQFNRALNIFNPWYTGPLLTPSATMVPPGEANFQPYLYITDTYNKFNSERKSVNIPNLVSVNPIAILQFGVTDSVDIGISLGGIGNWELKQQGGGFNDMTCTLGFRICPQSNYVPKIKFSIQETFPTGQYQNLSSNGLGLSSTGGGSFQTRFALAFGKLFFWTTPHPFNTRLFFGYTIPTPVSVKGFNTYGGGFGTKGTVQPGNTFATDLGLELSLTEEWVIALDIAYTATNQTKFHGKSGLNADGTPASIGGGYSDNLSLAPAIEYNWSSNLGILGGLWFPVYGRNSGNFISAIISVDWAFDVVK